MTTILLLPETEATVDSTAIDVAGGSTVLDSGAVPYATATLELPLLENDQLEWLDPRDGVRVPHTFGDVGGASRACNLGLRSRIVDHDAKKVTLRLAGDEAMMMDCAALVDDSSPFGYQASLRAVVNHVLGIAIPGAVLAPGEDAAVTAFWRVTNYSKNPAARANANGYAAGTGTSSIGRHTDITWNGLPSVRFSASGAGEAYLDTPGRAAARPGEVWTYSYHLLTAGTQRAARTLIRFKDAFGAVVAQYLSPSVTPAGDWLRVSGSAVAPPGTTTVEAYATTVTNSAGQAHYTSGHMLTNDRRGLLPWFDGGSALAGYVLQWDYPTDTSASTSTRNPTLERLPESLTWRAGQFAWDFLLPLVTSAGMVLWCDEQRVWRLAKAESRMLGTVINVSATNTRDGTDTLSRAPEASPTGVVVIYRWRNPGDDTPKEAVDSAGTRERVLRVELDSPYPGPGSAAAILARRQGTGRAQDVTAISRADATPGMSAQISLPGAPDTLGRITRVEFDHALGFMTLGTSGLVDYDDDDYLGTSDVLDWDDVAALTDWDDL